MGRDTRIVGERGQITIPKELRERFGIRGGDEVVVRSEDEKIVIAQRTVDDRLEEGYRKWAERDRSVARSIAADGVVVDDGEGAHDGEDIDGTDADDGDDTDGTDVDDVPTW